MFCIFFCLQLTYGSSNWLSSFAIEFTQNTWFTSSKVYWKNLEQFFHNFFPIDFQSPIDFSQLHMIRPLESPHFDDSFSLIKKYFVWKIKSFIHPTRVQFFCTAFTNFTNFLKINDNSIWNISKSLKKEKNSYTANRIFSFLQLDILYVISRWYCTTHNCILFKNPFSKERSRECAVIVVVWVKKLSTQL